MLRAHLPGAECAEIGPLAEDGEGPWIVHRAEQGIADQPRCPIERPADRVIGGLNRAGCVLWVGHIQQDAYCRAHRITAPVVSCTPGCSRYLDDALMRPCSAAAFSTRSLIRCIWTAVLRLMRSVIPASSTAADGFVLKSCTHRIRTPSERSSYCQRIFMYSKTPVST